MMLLVVCIAGKLMLCFPMLLCGFSASSVLLSGAPASNIFPMALRPGAQASNISADTAPPASNSFPMALSHGAQASNISAATAPLPATNLIRRRGVLRFG